MYVIPTQEESHKERDSVFEFLNCYLVKDYVIFPIGEMINSNKKGVQSL